MWSLLALAILGYIAFISNPNDESFRSFLTPVGASGSSSSGSSSGWASKAKGLFQKLVRPLVGGAAAQLPRFKRFDYVLLCVVVLDAPGNPAFLGIFGSWFALSTELLHPQSSAAARRNISFTPDGHLEVVSMLEAGGGLEAEAEAQQLRKRAIQLKLDKQYSAAADKFFQAGKLLERGGGSATETAEAYEDAYKMWKMAGPQEMHRALDALDISARICAANGRHQRAAANMEKIGEAYENAWQEAVAKEEKGNISSSSSSGGSPMSNSMLPGSFDSVERGVGGCFGKGTADLVARAMHHWREASRLYLIEDDGRYLTAASRWANLAAETGQFEAATQEFETLARHASQGSVQRLRVNQLLSAACLAIIGLGDSVRLSKTLDRYDAEFPGFSSSREHRVMRELLNAMLEGDAEAFAAASRGQDELSRLKKWELNALLGMKRKLADAEASIL